MAQQQPFNWYGRSDGVAVSAGQKADSSFDVIDSLAAQAVIPAGTLLQRGTDPETQAVALTTGAFCGVAVHKHTDPLYCSAGYPIGYEMPVMRLGRIYIKAGAAITAGADVALGADAQHVITATSGKKSLGRAITTVTTAEDLVVVEVNVYGSTLA